MNDTNHKEIQSEAVFKIIIFLGFAYFFYRLIQSGTVQLYVHVRMIPYLKFAIGAFVLMAFFTLGEIVWQAPRRTPFGRYTLFLITLLMAISIPAAVAVPDSMFLGGTNIASNISSSKGILEKESGKQQDICQTGKQNKVGNFNLGNAEWGLLLQDGKVVMDDNTFISWLNEIYERPDAYQGIEIETSGFVFRSAGFLQDQFVSARMMMVCCAADAQPVGFLCSYSKALDLPGDTWIKVSGKISRCSYNGNMIPLIKVEKVVPIEKPDNEYVYPPE